MTTFLVDVEHLIWEIGYVEIEADTPEEALRMVHDKLEDGDLCDVNWDDSSEESPPAICSLRDVYRNELREAFDCWNATIEPAN